jgi:alpha-tubulin suppressor-like RCC1 family protein
MSTGGSLSTADVTKKSNDKENSHISPKEAFREFDTDASGDIDEDEFFHLLETIGIKADEEYQERMFRKFVKRGSTIDFDGFKHAWLLLGNPKQELLDRGVKNLPKFATKHQLVKMLEKVLEEEERLESLAKAEAARWHELQERTNERTKLINKAKGRAGMELGAALDAAGQVYVMGSGMTGQFRGKPKNTSTASYQQIGLNLMQSIWNERVAGMSRESKRECIVNNNTAGIWGRQPTKVALTDSSIFALTNSGLLAWGGNDNWQDVSATRPRRSQSQTTPRSSVLLMNNQQEHQRHLTIIKEEKVEKLSRAVRDVQQMESVLRYYEKWPLHFDDTEDDDMVRNHLLTNVLYDQLLHSLELRGKPCEGTGLSKMELAEMFSDDILLEKEVLGEEGHLELCDIEAEVIDLNRRGKAKSANHLKLQIVDKWSELRKIQKKREMEAEENAQIEKRKSRMKSELDYDRWRERRSLLRNAPVTEQRGLLTGSITSRGRELQTPRGISQCKDIVCGSNHAAIIVQESHTTDGKLYSWGIGTLGRLGTAKHSDCDSPMFVEELRGVSIVGASCGQSHSAAISSDGILFMWGADAASLGFGELPDGDEYFCSIPTRLVIPSCKSVVRVSCGYSHTACVGKSGEVYIWGCGNGGRLGLGLDRMGTQHTPAVVDSLRHERIVDVSCGCYQTLALTMTEEVGANSPVEVKRLTGGRLYVAGGPQSVLGSSYPTFGQINSLSGLVIKQISAGYTHQSFVSHSGELYSWGSNLHGCCGQDESLKVITEPKKVHW